MSDRLPPAVQAHAEALQWYGYKVTPMTASDMVTLAVRHGFRRVYEIADVLDMPDKRVSNTLNYLAERARLVNDQRGNWSIPLEDV